MNAPGWESAALCRGEDPKLFAPADYSAARVADAKRICWRCPARQDCLADALANETGTTQQMRSTVRGGLTPRERAEHDRGIKEAA